jgi:hypothetical protein
VTQAVLPDGTVLEFPDGTPDAVIDRTVKIHLTGMGPKEPPVAKAGVSPFMDFALSATRGMMTGGPLMGLLQGSSESLDKDVKRAAYNVGGAATDASAGLVNPDTAAKIGLAANVGLQAVPSILTGGVARSAVGEPMRNMGRWLMNTAVKPLQKHRESGKAEQAIETMLEKGISPTRGSLSRVETRVSSLNNEVEAILSSSEGRVSTTAVANRLADVLKKAEKQALGKDEAEAVRKYWDEFVESHPENIPVLLANELKKGTYKSLGDRPYLTSAGSPDLSAKTKVEKALAGGLKDEIAVAEPSVGPLLKEQSDLINVLKVAGNRASQNNNPMGLSLIAPNQMQLLAFLADRSAAAKGLLARGLYSGSDALPLAGGALAGGALMSETGQPENIERGALYRYLRDLIPPKR